jgi:hypothetical protein
MPLTGQVQEIGSATEETVDSVYKVWRRMDANFMQCTIYLHCVAPVTEHYRECCMFYDSSKVA